MNRTTGPRSGFTLIELLIVIAIIAILAAILFPVFSKAREKARQASCVSNLKQISVALLQYEQDFDEFHPTIQEASTGGYNISWQYLVYPYIRSVGVFQCPSNTNTDVVDSNPALGLPQLVDDYAGNIGCENNQWYQTSHYQGCGAFGGYGKPIGVSQFVSPSTTIDVLEVRGNANNGNTPVPGSPMYGTSNFWSAPFYGIEWVSDDTDWNNQLFAGHTGQANFLFVDGHVKTLTPSLTVTSTLNMWTVDNTQTAQGWPGKATQFNVANLEAAFVSAKQQFQ